MNFFVMRIKLSHLFLIEWRCVTASPFSFFVFIFFAVYFLLESTEKNVRTFDLKRAHAFFRLNARFK